MSAMSLARAVLTPGTERSQRALCEIVQNPSSFLTPALLGGSKLAEVDAISSMRKMANLEYHDVGNGVRCEVMRFKDKATEWGTQSERGKKMSKAFLDQGANRWGKDSAKVRGAGNIHPIVRCGNKSDWKSWGDSARSRFNPGRSMWNFFQASGSRHFPNYVEVEGALNFERASHTQGVPSADPTNSKGQRPMSDWVGGYHNFWG